MAKIFGVFLGMAVYALYLGAFVGWAWWIWVAFHLHSFWMFLLALIPFTTPFVAVLGLWSLIFGMPDWVLHLVINKPN